MLANIYLHYVFNLWSERRQRTQLRGAMIVVRYGDDMVVGFEHREEAEAGLGSEAFTRLLRIVQQVKGVILKCKCW